MILSRTPYRISFFGGGTDYPQWFLKNDGEVLSSTINKYLYVSIRNLPPFFDHKFRVVYSKIEMVKDYNKISHGVIREGLRLVNHGIHKNGYEIHYDGDIPARSGLGSSSSFVVGFLNALYSQVGLKITPKILAEKSILLEQKILSETVGSQDQIAASFGGLNSIKFLKNNTFKVKKIISNDNTLKDFSKNFMMVFTGINRTAKFVANTYVNKLNKKRQDLNELMDQVKWAKKLLISKNYQQFGELLNETWKIKRMLSSSVSNDVIDRMYEGAMKNGAVGGKLLGAGGGGFFLFYVEEKNKKRLKRIFKKNIVFDFNLTNDKSEIIFKN
jgi:D-glycero-alpha-D-manno-heptose-7-phosphate kinase